MPRTVSGAPIHRQSQEKGTFERGWYRPLAPALGRRLQVAAERYTRERRKPGDRSGPIGHVAQELLGVLIRLQHATPEGRLEPAYLTLCRMLRRSVDAVWRALDQLETAGLLERVRRVTPAIVDSTWRWQQTSNAYRLLVPAWVAASLPVVMTPPPAPEDLAFAASAASAERHDQERSLPLKAYAGHVVAEHGLAAALARFGAAVQRRHDSARRSESLPVPSLEEDCGVALTGHSSGGLGAPTAPEGAIGVRTAKAAPS